MCNINTSAIKVRKVFSGWEASCCGFIACGETAEEARENLILEHPEVLSSKKKIGVWKE